MECFARPLAVCLVVVASGPHAQDDAIGPDVGLGDEVVDRRNQLAPSEVSRAAEDDEEMTPVLLVWFEFTSRLSVFDSTHCVIDSIGTLTIAAPAPAALTTGEVTEA